MTLAEPFDPLLSGPNQPRWLSRPRFPLGERIPVIVTDESGQEVPGDAGINLAQSESLAGVVVAVEPWLGQQAGQRVDLYWAGEQVACDCVTVVGSTLFLQVPAEHLPGQGAASIAVFYRVHLSANDVEDSEPARILLKLNRPGGKDRDASQPGHQGLPVASLPPALIEHGVDGAAAAAGVPVTIDGYENLRVRDRIELRWGNQQVLHTVTQAQAADKRVVLTVNEQQILDAGDSDSLRLDYRVSDEVRNDSQDADLLPWSAPSQAFEVYASNSSLPAAYVLVNDQYVEQIELLAVGAGDAWVEVATYPADFAPGQWLRMLWRGTTEDGRVVDIEESRELSRVPGTERFRIANDKLLELAGGTARVSYEVSAVPDDPNARGSRRRTLSVLGVPLCAWHAPRVPAAVNGNVAADAGELEVEIDLLRGCPLGLRLTLVCSAILANQQRVVLIRSHQLSRRELRRGTLSFSLPAALLKMLAHQRLRVSLLIEGKEGPTMELQVEALQDAYAAAQVEQLRDGLLDPAELGGQGATLVIAPDSRFSVGDPVMFFWRSTEPGGSAADTSAISSLTRPLKFDVPRDVVQAGSGGTVSLIYQVTPANGELGVSEPLAFSVGPRAATRKQSVSRGDEVQP
ncbi:MULTISPECIES: hypothetical protein [Pseudomonas]|uniref:Uncharacterized protein n=1 Tax=Pseudomonas fluorescens TaxID=294 RepID=A0A5E6VUK7_PSEFL|nr:MULTISPECIES: hypothetical protein [Pseudomonas]VVN17199.1 hypothetical protein PS652_04127 [Pseudomonas fluorescens]